MSSLLLNVALNYSICSILVEAAAAPINTEGIPCTKMMGAAMKQVILAVDDEEADRVLW